MRRTAFVTTGVLLSALVLATPVMADRRVSVASEHGGVGWERQGRHGFGPERFRGFAFGFGMPVWSYGSAPYAGYWAPGYDGYGFGQNPYPYAGGVKLQIAGPNPKHAEVYANGEFVGTENQFRGFFHQLSLRPGDYTIEVRAKGYDPLRIPVHVQFDRTITYKGRMKKLT